MFSWLICRIKCPPRNRSRGYILYCIAALKSNLFCTYASAPPESMLRFTEICRLVTSGKSSGRFPRNMPPKFSGNGCCGRGNRNRYTNAQEHTPQSTRSHRSFFFFIRIQSIKTFVENTVNKFLKIIYFRFMRSLVCTQEFQIGKHRKSLN